MLGENTVSSSITSSFSTNRERVSSTTEDAKDATAKATKARKSLFYINTFLNYKIDYGLVTVIS